MKNKKDFYKLDEIGIVGTQKKISATERRKVQKETGKIIEGYRNAMKNASSKKIKKAS
ncbi:MAG: hypothetical protein ACJ751_19575 [Niastella sp.]|uniref:hypothetical protein n=1 Tax=Niastella sp. TaxID=1869183 RepID=UPI00389A05B5